MKVTTERLPESLVRLEIAAEPEESAQAVERAYRKISRDIVLPGFRKGKVPRHMLERLVGREVWVEEANKNLIDDLYRKALQQEELVPVGDPELELVAAEPLEFKVTVPVYPTADPGDYTAVRAEPVDASIDEAKIDEVIEQLRLNQSPWVDPAEPRTPRDGDQATVDIHIREGEEDFQPPVEDAVFVLGESNLIDELRTAIDGLTVDQSATVEISFPEEGENVVSDRRRGKTLSYTVTLKDLKERDLLPLDDDFAKTYANADSLEALRERTRGNLHAERTGEARTEAINRIIDTIAEGATVEVPQAMVDDAITEEVARLRQRLAYSGVPLEAYLRRAEQTEQELREELRPNVAKRLRNSLILRQIAEREGIEIADAEIESEIETLIADMPARDEAREVYRTSDYLRSTVRNDLYDRRLTDRLIELATEGRGAVINGWTPPPPSEETTETPPADGEMAEATAPTDTPEVEATITATDADESETTVETSR
ncbi:MAG: trigger factor [Thermomicrobiales bacterium]|nr:trigger factor [Thermomicrobiales bacterium]